MRHVRPDGAPLSIRAPGPGAPRDPAPAGGLLALGDSITVGEGDAMPGVPCRPWVQWLARDLGLQLTNLAANGAQVGDLLRAQLPRVSGAFRVACLYCGVNDVRGPDFDPGAFARELDAVAAALGTHAPRLLMVTVPLDLGRPRAGAKVLDANRAIREVAGRHGATLLANEGRRGWRRVLPDAVHLTALGQRELAADALRALGGDGVAPSPPAPATSEPHTPAARELGRALRYAVGGYAPALWHDLRRRAREGTLLVR